MVNHPNRLNTFKMKQVLHIALFFVFSLAFVSTADAQSKFAYTNSAALLAEMPDVKRADTKLEALKKQLQKKGQQMLDDLRNKYADLQKRYENGLLSKVQAEQEAQKLAEEEQKLAKYEQDMYNQLASKREELIKPILEKVQTAIDDVAKEKGYSYVFDTNTMILLYAKPEDDITPAVKVKLGM